MNKTKSFLPIIIILLFYYSCNQNSKRLFQESGTDWSSKGEAQWSFVANELIGTSTDGLSFMITKEKFRNFELSLEFNPDNTVNSGVFVRCKNKEISAVNCYELNIWDYHPNQDNRTGAVVARAKPLAKVETTNKWNTYKIKCENNRIQAWINGVLTADIIDEELSEGLVSIQAAGEGEVKFRAIKLLSLE